ncbi:MAG: sulfur transferase domain-containing protein [Woeseiaceae bacterium]|nr:sulfur transferase domain-containing protein [Woeseiaceae bacterium]
MKTNRLVFLSILAATAACADNAEAPAARPYVDVDTIASVEDVAPVDGLRAAGQPDAAALKVFRDAGYRAVIDIRGPDEDRGMDEAAVAEELGLDYVSLPVVGSEAINFETARQLDSLLQRYDEPVLVHCGSSNRVGALLALRKRLDGASEGEALEYGRSAGLGRLTPVVEERLKAGE